MKPTLTLVTFLLFVKPTLNVLRNISLLHLGGTISGAAESATNTTHYKAGVVVSTGTSNLNELLVHLSLSIKSNKPVVPTAAFKPDTAYDADGRQNIISATILASTPRWSEENNEVVAVVGGTIGLPWGLRKEDGYFEARFGSSMGTIKRGKLYLNDISDCYTTEKIDARGYSPTGSLPEVSLLTSYSGFDGRLVRLAVDDGVRAFVITAYDDGYMPDKAAQVIEKVIEEYDIPIVAASYNPSIPVEHARVKGMIPGLDLDPRQLRQLLTGHVLNGSDRTMIAKSIERVSESMDCRARIIKN